MDAEVALAVRSSSRLRLQTTFVAKDKGKAPLGQLKVTRRRHEEMLGSSFCGEKGVKGSVAQRNSQLGMEGVPTLVAQK